MHLSSSRLRRRGFSTPDRHIQFDVGDLPAGESAVVSYAAQVRTGDEAPPEGTPLNGNATASSLAGGGASASADVIFGTLDDGGSSTAPTGLTATAADGQVSLSWDANSESDLAGYNVYRSPSFFSDPIDEKKLNTSLLSDSSYTDTGITSEGTYYYQVTAVDEDGNESGPSEQVSATVSSGPFADWPDLADPSITLRIVQPDLRDIAKVELVREEESIVKPVKSGFAEFPLDEPIGDSITEIRLLNEEDQVFGYLPFQYTQSNYEEPFSIDAVIYIHEESKLSPSLGDWSGEWEYYDDLPLAKPLSMLVPPKGEIDSVDLNQQDPVVLVHGVSGRYPAWGGIQTVRELVGHLSSSGYDAWQFYYPENQNITKSGPLLAKAIHRLQNDLGYGTDQSFDLVAHSMGGLVSRHYVQRMGIGSTRSTYSQVLSFDPGEPGEDINKFLMLGTPNHGSYASWRCTEKTLSACGNHPPINKDEGAPAFRQMSPGSRFFSDLNRSQEAGEAYSQSSTLVLAGTRNPRQLEIFHEEIPDQDDGFVAASSASLLDLEVPLAVGDFTHTGAYAFGSDVLNEDTDAIISNTNCLG